MKLTKATKQSIKNQILTEFLQEKTRQATDEKSLGAWVMEEEYKVFIALYTKRYKHTDFSTTPREFLTTSTVMNVYVADTLIEIRSKVPKFLPYKDAYFITEQEWLEVAYDYSVAKAYKDATAIRIEFLSDKINNILDLINTDKQLEKEWLEGYEAYKKVLKNQQVKTTKTREADDQKLVKLTTEFSVTLTGWLAKDINK